MGNNESKTGNSPSKVISAPTMESVRSSDIKIICKADNKTVVASIDFGTTYSGYAYIFRKEYETNPLSIHLNDWKPGRSVWKAPTTVLFNPQKEFHSFGYKAEEEYTKLCQKKENHSWYCFRKFKMQLHNKLVLKKELHLEDETGKEMPAMGVFSAAILYLKRDILEKFERKNPGFKELDIHWVLTIPAIWTEAAKQFMIEAAKMAEIHPNQLSLCLEPEAAAIFCKTLPDFALHDSRDGELLQCFKPGGRYMVLDLGGGTVDTAIHEVREDGSLIEIEKSSGGGWGGTQVDEEFMKYINNKYGDDAITELKKISPRDWLDMISEFEMQKRLISCTEDTDLRLKLPTRLLLNSSMAVDNQTVEHLYVRYQDFVSFFQSTTQKIVTHIKGLLSRNSNITLILVVGGFAESEYVRSTLIKEFSGKRIIVPHDCSVAVLKGAVLYGFAPTIISARVCQYTYGIRVNREFDENIHPSEFKEIVDGQVVCRNVFKVLVREGEAVEIRDTKFHQVCSTHKEKSRRHVEMVIPIFASRNRNVLYTTDDGCEMIGKVLIHPPKSGWPLEVTYWLMIQFGRTEFSIGVQSEGKQEYKVTCEFLQ